jgi:hypothetical protein
MIELKRHIGLGVSGRQIDVGQWQVLVDGRLVAYLNYAVDSALQPAVGDFPMDRMTEILAECKRQRYEFDPTPSEVYPPTEANTRFMQVYSIIKSQIEEDEDDE